MSDDSSQPKPAAAPPAPEVLRPQSDDPKPAEKPTDARSSDSGKGTKKPKRSTYRPSHKATFIGVGVVVGVLLINAIIVFFVINGQNAAQEDALQTQVTLSTETLDKLGVSKTPIGDEGTKLIVGLDSEFEGTLTVAGDVSLAGQLRLNNALIASDANLEKLQAGDVTIEQLSVNGDGTISTLNLRKDLNVIGTARLQGAVTISQLLTVNNNVNILGNLAVGGVLTARGFQASSLVSDTTLTIGGHIITSGAQPGHSRGSALRATDTVSMSGNDASGTVQVNIGAGSISGGTLINITFRNDYTNTPHVIVSPVGGSPGGYFVNRTASGFSISTSSGMSYGGYAFDYIVVQ
jgi:cytoskeletal protein CcmA (bactofilin family)